MIRNLISAKEWHTISNTNPVSDLGAIMGDGYLGTIYNKHYFLDKGKDYIGKSGYQVEVMK